MGDIRLATEAAALVLDLHERTLAAAEGGPDKAEEWAKLRADYVSACTTTAAVIASAFQDMLAALERIAESRDAGRHDGLREECPLHDQYTMWLDARAALSNCPAPVGKGPPAPRSGATPNASGGSNG